MSVHSPTLSTPWSDPSRKVKDVAVEVNENEATREVEWYQPVMKKLPSSTVEVFMNYAGLADEKETIEHIYAVRDKAWDVLPYPCIGLFRFLDFSIHLSPIYPTVVDRLRNGETLLDLGCCLGQDLRKVAYDSGVSTNLIGADIEAPFLELGYELFRDRDRFQGELRAGSIFDEDFLSEKCGKINMIYLGSFLHLFNTEQQAVIIAKLEKLLCPGPGALVFGRNLGAEQGGEFHMESIGWDLYRHSNETMQNLWASTGNRKWTVESSLSRYGSVAWDDSRRTWQGDETKQMMFVAISQ